VDITPADAPAMNGTLTWSPDSASLYFCSNNDREFLAVARHEVGANRLTWLATDDSADLTGWPSPDGSTLLVERNVDGASALLLHDAVSGARLADIPLPGLGTVVQHNLPSPRWAPNSASVALSISGPTLPGDVLLVNRTRGAVGFRLLTRSARALAGEQTVIPELHAVPTPDGELVPCMVYRPATAAPARDDLAGSAVLVLHGGPVCQAKQTFDIMVQALAAAGHAVLVPNVRPGWPATDS